MNVHPRNYLVIALVQGWSNLRGGLNTVRVLAMSPEDAVLHRCRSILKDAPSEPTRFVVVDLLTNDSTMVEYVPPQQPKATARTISPEAI